MAIVMRNVFKIKDLPIGKDCTVLARVKTYEIKSGKNGAYLAGDLSDASGTIPFRIWGDKATEVIDSKTVKEGTVIKAVITTSTYRGEKQCVVSVHTVITDPEDLEGAEPHLSEVSPFSKKGLIASLKALINKAHEIDTVYPDFDKFKEILTEHGFWDDFVDYPAAKKVHQAYKHGLLEHSLFTAKYAVGVGELYRRDVAFLIYSGILHDIGKCRTYEIDRFFAVKDVTVSGVLEGHLVLGSRIVREMFKGILPNSTIEKMAHVCISHHGELEYGSAVMPAFVEAAMIHAADIANARYPQYKEGEELEGSGCSVKFWTLDGAYALTKDGFDDLNSLDEDPEESDDEVHSD